MLPSAPKEQPVAHGTEGDPRAFACHAACLVLATERDSRVQAQDAMGRVAVPG